MRLNSLPFHKIFLQLVQRPQSSPTFNRRWSSLAVGTFGLTWPGLVSPCWDAAGTRYQVNPDLLYAIAKCESGMRPTVVNPAHGARAGTYDIGLMQINSSHLERLGVFGITERHLYDSCTNIHVGAWILSEQIRRYGLSWNAVGAYNAACTKLNGKECNAARSRYAWCVYRNLPVQSVARSFPQRTRQGVKVMQVPPILAVRKTGAEGR
jgi:soluble lytic murein transglycosylase-like protein